MGLPLKSLCVVGFFGVVGLLGMKVVAPTRIAKFFWFRSLAQRQVITNGQQDNADRQIAGDPERATPVTGSILSLGEGPTSTGKITVQEIERLKASLEEMGQFLQEKDALKAQLNHLRKEMKDPEISTGKIQAEEIKRLQAKLEKQDQLLQDKTAALSSAEQLIHDLSATNQRQREEIMQMKTARHTSADSQISMLAPPTIVNKADSISVAEVVEVLKMLNAYIEQAASHIADSLTCRESSSEETEDALNELIDYIGPWLCNDLRSKSKESSTEPDHLHMQIALQTGLVNACNHIVNNGIPPSDGATLSRTHSDLLEAGQIIADAQRAHPHTYATTSQSEAWETNRRYLTEIALKMITAVGGSLESGALPPQYREVLDEIAKGSLTLYKAINEDAALLMELVTCTIPCDAIFDPSRMEDTEGGGNETGHVTQDTVICTMEMGLQCRKRNESVSREEWAVSMKTKVVLASTLEA
ncbi:hypothetical protein M378DRAFT_163740 [Amanita muscaria Koide BX008]|uniref:Uncharacterized protein n=1 Tax=Amanita muscaria (strain Koide BX008) TaxID=946122 RepID=A0A0C2X451_AMAMK|nr:hypothetical protein M378DRAFT_163740 [Amanita muscaria Koide BX008]